MSRPPYSMYLYARSAGGPPYPIYLYAGYASGPPYPIYLYARYASRPPCPIYLYARSARRPPCPILGYYCNSRNRSHGCAVKMKTNPMYSSIPSLACIHLYGCNNQKSEVLKKKKKQRRVTYLLGQQKEPSVPYTRWTLFFPGVANRYASTSKALVRVIKFRYSFTSSSPPSNELLRIKLLLAHRSDQQPIAPFYFIP